jgi:FAD/FMN-containing dehydrogenase
MTKYDSAVSAVVAHLKKVLPRGQVLTGRSYEESRHIWNGAVDQHPALIVRPKTSQEVQTTVLAARESQIPLSVRGGGHDWAGRSIRDNGLVIDLSAMQNIMVDPEQRVATIQGGATAGQVMAAATTQRLAVVAGTTGDVGMAGLTLGGGYGPFNGRFGLALDSMLSANVVLADGRLVTANYLQEPELFWALRGAGGNFGVVTAMRVQLHPVEWVLAGFITYSWAQASDVWTRLGEILAESPDELTVLSGMAPGPDGEPTVMVSPVWSGLISEGERHLERFQKLGTRLHSQIARTSPADMLTQFDAQVVAGRHYGMRTRTVHDYSPGVIAALIKAGDTKTSPFSGVYLHHFHGAATRVRDDATAFGIRHAHYMVEVLAAWEPDDAPRNQRAWADSIASDLTPHAIPGGYANLLGPNDHDQAADAYGPNAMRLLAAKARYDPSGVFSAIPLPRRPN